MLLHRTELELGLLTAIWTGEECILEDAQNCLACITQLLEAGVAGRALLHIWVGLARFADQFTALAAVLWLNCRDLITVGAGELAELVVVARVELSQSWLQVGNG